MFSRIQKIKVGELDIKTVNDEFVEEINEEYVYKKFGGKDKFEETLKRRAEEKKLKDQKKAQKAQKAQKEQKK